MYLSIITLCYYCREEFSNYATEQAHFLFRQLTQTPEALKSADWMKGPRDIHDDVRRKRLMKNKSTLDLLKWLGMDHKVERPNFGNTIIMRDILLYKYII